MFIIVKLYNNIEIYRWENWRLGKSNNLLNIKLFIIAELRFKTRCVYF